MKIEFQLTGTMPLLMHQDDVEAADEVKEWQRDPANKNISIAGDDRSPAWVWQTYLYHDGENVVMPAQNIMVCLRQAGTQMILKKQKTFKEISQSGLLIEDEFCEFTAGGKPLSITAIHNLRDKTFKQMSDAVEKMGFRLFVKRAVIGKAKHVRVRPRFDKWTVSGTMLVIAPEITYDHVEMMFGIAGRVGLGDWRPGCKTPGPFGMFSAKLKKVA